jgi:hypothetical protein
MSSKLVRRSVRFSKILSNPVRMMPSFLLIGAQKCGTTSVFNNLVQHPQICSPSKKEIGFFSSNFDKGISWYKSFFPVPQDRKRSYITGEASTGYICHPHAASRVAQTLPQIKLMVMLRNPIDRAYSHYHHTARMGKENLPFAEAIYQEEARVGEIKAKISQDGNYYHKDYHYYTYLSRGLYAQQLKPWLALFERSQFLILQSEDFFAQPAVTFEQILNFLELPDWEMRDFPQYNPNRYSSPLDSTLRQELAAYFRPHNQQLNELLNLNFDWN